MNSTIVSAAIGGIASVIVAVITVTASTSGLRKEVQALEALPVGSIVSSMLNETQFDSQSEGKWVLADGRRVSGSDYARITNKENVPSLVGQFIRGLDESGDVDPDGNSRTLGDIQAGALIDHKHKEQKLRVTGGFYQHSRNPQGVAGHGDNTTPLYDTVESSAPIGNNLSTSRENRPTNVAVNFYIKINRL